MTENRRNGERLRKREPLEEIRIERGALDAILARLPRREMTRAGVTPGGWSIKDILAHIVDWQDRNLRWYEAGARGQTVAVPEAGFTWRDLPRLNQSIYRKHHRRSLDAILTDYVAFHEGLVALAETVADEDLVAMGRYSWTGPTWTLSDYIRANTASHYRWARTHIRRRLRRPVRL